MGEGPGFSLDREQEEAQAFEDAGYESLVITPSSQIGVYTIWSKIQPEKAQDDEPQDS